MSKVIMFSTRFPADHPKAGQPTYFVEKIWKGLIESGKDIGGREHIALAVHIKEFYKNGEKIWDYAQPKYHTIREGHRFKEGEYFSPRIWGNDINPKSGKSGAHQSKQIVIAPDIKVEKVWDFEIKEFADSSKKKGYWIDFGSYNIHPDFIEGSIVDYLAKNDGLNTIDLLNWFQYPKPFDGRNSLIRN